MFVYQNIIDLLVHDKAHAFIVDYLHLGMLTTHPDNVSLSREAYLTRIKYDIEHTAINGRWTQSKRVIIAYSLYQCWTTCSHNSWDNWSNVFVEQYPIWYEQRHGINRDLINVVAI